MVVGTIEKTPFEEIDVSVDFSPRLAAGVTISSISVVATDAQGNVVTSALVAASPTPVVIDNVAFLRVIGGTPGIGYYVSVLGVTSNGQQVEGTIAINITEW